MENDLKLKICKVLKSLNQKYDEEYSYISQVT